MKIFLAAMYRLCIISTFKRG